MAGPNDNAILDLLALQGSPEAPENLDSTLAMLIRNNGGNAPVLASSQASSISPAPEALLKSNGSRDIYGVNAAEGGNRVNKNTAEFGVKATQGADGKVTLTNVGVQPSSPSGSVTASMPNISNDLFASINQLKTTSDPDIARGLLGNIRESAAQKSSALMTEAMNFASSKLGVPFLETQLREAEVADRADPEWYPGIGDSPITAKIRATLLTTRSSVDNEAKNYLATNTSFASMNAALKTAEEEAKRIDVIGQRKDLLTDRNIERQAIKDEEAISKATAIKNTLSPEELKRITVLNPTLANIADPKDSARSFAETVERADKNPAMRAALGATDQDLPLLAMENNPFATTLTIAKEQELNPSASKDEIETRLMKIASASGSPAFIDAAVKTKFGTKFNSPEAKAYKAELASSGLGLDAAGKKLQRAQKYAMALDMYKAEATDRFASDTASWGIQDPEFLVAQEKAFKVTGRRDMESVLTAYMESTDPTISLQKVAAFKLLATGAAGKTAKSLFGTPDSLALDAMIINATRTNGLWEAIRKVTQLPSIEGTSMAPLGGLGAIALGSLGMLNN